MKRMGSATLGVAAIGVLAVSTAGLGAARAAGAGPLLLGKANHATTLTTLSRSSGTPLSLKAGKGAPPLAVNNDTLVKHLNAAKLGGLSASNLQTYGSGANTPANGGDRGVDQPLGSIFGAPDPVATTARRLPPGWYYVSSTALMDLDSKDDAICLLTDLDDSNTYAIGGGAGPGRVQSAADAVVHLTKPGGFAEYCILDERGGSATGKNTLNVAGIFAIKVDQSKPGLALKPAPADQR